MSIIFTEKKIYKLFNKKLVNGVVITMISTKNNDDCHKNLRVKKKPRKGEVVGRILSVQEKNIQTFKNLININ